MPRQAATSIRRNWLIEVGGHFFPSLPKCFRYGGAIVAAICLALIVGTIPVCAQLISGSQFTIHRLDKVDGIAIFGHVLISAEDVPIMGGARQIRLPFCFGIELLQLVSSQFQDSDIGFCMRTQNKPRQSSVRERGIIDVVVVSLIGVNYRGLVFKRIGRCEYGARVEWTRCSGSIILEVFGRRAPAIFNDWPNQPRDYSSVVGANRIDINVVGCDERALKRPLSFLCFIQSTPLQSENANRRNASENPDIKETTGVSSKIYSSICYSLIGIIFLFVGWVAIGKYLNCGGDKAGDIIASLWFIIAAGSIIHGIFYIALASADRGSENIVIVFQLKFRDVERHIFAADAVKCADNAAFENRPEAFNRVGVNRGDDKTVLGMPKHLVRIVSQSPIELAFVGPPTN
jgi:hypothetical protein